MASVFQTSPVISAFARGWRTLLHSEEVTSENIETVPRDLLEGVMKAAQQGQSDEMLLTAAGLDYVRWKISERARQVQKLLSRVH